MLKEQIKVYSGEESFCLGPSIAEVDPRADYVRGITSRLDGVNSGEIPKGPPERDKELRCDRLLQRSLQL
jgi:hypothetical protein